MGKAITLDLSYFIGKRLGLLIRESKDWTHSPNVIERFEILCKFTPKFKLKCTVLNVIPIKFIPNSEPRYNRVRSSIRHKYSCLIVTDKYNYTLKFTSSYIIQYITIGNLVYKRNDKIWEKQE